MTAKELFDLIEGLPPEALCGTIEYEPSPSGWFLSIGYDFADEFKVTDDHAEALQRDALTEWLCRNHYRRLIPEFSPSADGLDWYIDAAESPGGVDYYPTRTHALAAAVKFVAGKGKE